MTARDTHPWHAMPSEAAARLLESDAALGLPAADAARRLLADGPNEMEDRGGKGPWRIAAEQFTGLLVIVLLVAAAISLVLGDLKNAIAIAAIVVLNAAFGFVQE